LVQKTDFLILNASGTIVQAFIKSFGWYPNREYTTLSLGASLNATQLVLTDDLGLQQGDIIGIGCGSGFGEFYNFSSESNGYYTVSNYNASTKTVTLTTGLLTARLSGDYVAIFSRPIGISRTSGTTKIIGSINNITLVGTCVKTQLISASMSNYSSNNLFNHCSFNSTALNIVTSSIFNNCTIMNTAPLNQGCSNITFNQCFIIASDAISYSFNTNIILNNCVGTNCDDFNATSGCYGDKSIILKNCIFKNMGTITWGGGTHINGIYHGQESGHNTVHYGRGLIKLNMSNCVFNLQNSNPAYPMFQTVYGKLYNCLFNLPTNGSIQLDPTNLTVQIGLLLKVLTITKS
jgi:hypothetical protein